MSWKLNTEDENPLWRQYMDNVDMMDNKWLKSVDLKTPFPSKSFLCQKLTCAFTFGILDSPNLFCMIQLRGRQV